MWEAYGPAYRRKERPWTAHLVRQLVDTQVPQWAGLPLRPVDPAAAAVQLAEFLLALQRFPIADLALGTGLVERDAGTVEQLPRLPAY